jgi:hypothetical protein
MAASKKIKPPLESGWLRLLHNSSVRPNAGHPCRRIRNIFIIKVSQKSRCGQGKLPALLADGTA